jgi:hypothetical protein
MKTTPIDSELRARIDSFVAELSAMVKASAMSAVQEALGDGSAPVRRGPGRPHKIAAAADGERAVRRRGMRAKRSFEDVQAMADQVLSYVKEHDGQRLEEISAGLGVPSTELKLPVGKLLAGKQVRTEGQKRGTKYFATVGSAGGAPRLGRRKARPTRKAARRRSKRRGTRSAKAAAAGVAQATPAA